MKQKVLITGISGMLGSAVHKTFVESDLYDIYGVSRNSSISLVGVTMFYGDLSDEKLIKAIENESSFDVIIHCAAETNVNLCETNNEHAYKSNVLATKNLVGLNSKLFIYISTDSVFDGKIGNYSEQSLVNPLNYYAETKLLGENAVKQSKNDFLVLRTNIYGFSIPMKSSLFEWSYKELSNSNTISGFSNIYFNPLYVGQISELLLKWLQLKVKKGVYNVGSKDYISKYDFLKNIVHLFNFDPSNLIDKTFDITQFVAPRALNTTLNIFKIEGILQDFDYSLNRGLQLLKRDLDSIDY